MSRVLYDDVGYFENESRSCRDQNRGRGDRYERRQCDKGKGKEGLVHVSQMGYEESIDWLSVIKRVDLGFITSGLNAMLINDFLAFNFIDPPSPQALMSALEPLYTLGALDEEGILTELDLGKKQAQADKKMVIFFQPEEVHKISVVSILIIHGKGVDVGYAIAYVSKLKLLVETGAG
ncbi:hypothetical protein Tco_0583334 [Tanacetum coccineum]